MVLRRRSHRKTVIADRRKFVRMWMGGFSFRTIAEILGTSATTVSRWVRRWQREANLVSSRSAGMEATHYTTYPYTYPLNFYYHPLNSLGNTFANLDIEAYALRMCYCFQLHPLNIVHHDQTVSANYIKN